MLSPNRGAAHGSLKGFFVGLPSALEGLVEAWVTARGGTELVI